MQGIEIRVLLTLLRLSIESSTYLVNRDMLNLILTLWGKPKLAHSKMYSVYNWKGSDVLSVLIDVTK